jgi:preprotein translocase SecE subunit
MNGSTPAFARTVSVCLHICAQLFGRSGIGGRLRAMDPLPIGVGQPPRPPRPPAPPITDNSGGYGSSWDRPLRGPYRPHRRNFLRSVIIETRKIAWPTRSDFAHNAAICLGVLGLLIGAIAAVDVGLVALIRVAIGDG